MHAGTQAHTQKLEYKFHISKVIVLAWEPDESVSSFFFCTGICVWPTSRSDRFPADLDWVGLISTIIIEK